MKDSDIILLARKCLEQNPNHSFYRDYLISYYKSWAINSKYYQLINFCSQYSITIRYNQSIGRSLASELHFLCQNPIPIILEKLINEVFEIGYVNFNDPRDVIHHITEECLTSRGVKSPWITLNVKYVGHTNFRGIYIQNAFVPAHDTYMGHTYKLDDKSSRDTGSVSPVLYRLFNEDKFLPRVNRHKPISTKIGNDSFSISLNQHEKLFIVSGEEHHYKFLFYNKCFNVKRRIHSPIYNVVSKRESMVTGFRARNYIIPEHDTNISTILFSLYETPLHDNSIVNINEYYEMRDKCISINNYEDKCVSINDYEDKCVSINDYEDKCVSINDYEDKCISVEDNLIYDMYRPYLNTLYVEPTETIQNVDDNSSYEYKKKEYNEEYILSIIKDIINIDSTYNLIDIIKYETIRRNKWNKLLGTPQYKLWNRLNKLCYSYVLSFESNGCITLDLQSPIDVSLFLPDTTNVVSQDSSFQVRFKVDHSKNFIAYINDLEIINDDINYML